MYWEILNRRIVRSYTDVGTLIYSLCNFYLTELLQTNALIGGGWAEHILFLVDRIVLLEHALAAFKEHLQNESR